MKSFTDIEQSKKLAKILPLSSADMFWLVTGNTPRVHVLTDSLSNYSNWENYPCWSLAALFSLLPSEFTEVGKYATTSYEIAIRKHKSVNNVDLYQIAYGNYKFYEDGNSSWKDMINTGEKENLIDAAFDMIITLHEHKLIK